MSELRNSHQSVAGPETPRQLPNASFRGLLWLLLGVLFLLALSGVWYLLTNTSEEAPPAPTRPTAATNREPESSQAYAQTRALQTMSTSDQITALKADLESTRLDELLADLEVIATELELLE